MAKRGRAGPALATAAIGSFVAGTIATIVLTFDGADRRRLRAALRPRRIFRPDGAGVHDGVGGARHRRRCAGSRACSSALTIGLIGIDRRPGRRASRCGIPELLDGIDVVVVAVGLFAVGETLYIATYRNRDSDEIEPMKGSIWMTARTGGARGSRGCAARRSASRSAPCRPAARRSRRSCPTAIEKKLTKHPEEFGKGAIEGVAGPEAANNASATGVLVPLLTLGLPTSATAAIMLAAFQQYGLQPGPLLFETQPLLVWGLIASMYIGNVMLLILNLPLVGHLGASCCEIPRPLLYAGILIFATLGAYGLRNSSVRPGAALRASASSAS